MATKADKEATLRYQKKLKSIKFRFSLKEEQLYHDFKKKCEVCGVKPTTQIKSLIDQWTYLDIGFSQPVSKNDIKKHPSD